MPRIVEIVEIARPPEQVFDYACAPANWPEWHPQSVAVDVAERRTLRAGETLREEVRVAGRRGAVRWTVREHARPARWVIEGRAEHGGGTATIVYTLAPTAAGTRFERDLRYDVPGLWWKALDALFVRRHMRAASAAAVRRLKEAIERAPATG